MLCAALPLPLPLPLPLLLLLSLVSLPSNSEEIGETEDGRSTGEELLVWLAEEGCREGQDWQMVEVLEPSPCCCCGRDDDDVDPFPLDAGNDTATAATVAFDDAEGSWSRELLLLFPPGLLQVSSAATAAAPIALRMTPTGGSPSCCCMCC